MPSEAEPVTVYQAVGGQEFFDRLVERFYARVVEDPTLMPLYPADDIEGARHRLAGFLAQYWGGPANYSAERGHPRLRMRHAPFAIGWAERDAWMLHMGGAVAESSAPAEVQAVLLEYFEMAATHMINRPSSHDERPN